jgi:ubiquitin-protein ligase
MSNVNKPSYDFNDPLFRQRPHLIRLAKDHLSLLGLNNDIFDWEVIKTTDLDIPVVYHIHYKLWSIVGIDENLYPIYGDHHIAEMSLDRPYPLEPCKVYMKTDVWHPNIKWDGKLKGRVCSNVDKLGISFDLYALVWWVAEILQYKNYHAKNEPPYPEDINVAEWVLNFAEPRDIVNKYKGIFIEQDSEQHSRDDQIAASTKSRENIEDEGAQGKIDKTPAISPQKEVLHSPPKPGQEEALKKVSSDPTVLPEEEEVKPIEQIKMQSEKKTGSKFKISILKKVRSGAQENRGIKITPRNTTGAG